MTQISVIMLMRNNERYVREAVQSVLDQRDVDLELVVVDDGSTDRSRTVVEQIRDHRVRLVEGPCRGIAAARNTGLEAASGRFYSMCDSDDRYVAGRLAWQVDWLDSHEAFGAVCSGFSTMTVDGRHVADMDTERVDTEITDELRSGTTRTALNSFMTKSDILRQIGGFREYFETAEDLDLQLRLGEATRVWYRPGRCFWYRLHDDSITHVQSDVRRQFFEATARQMQEQRRSGQQDQLAKGDAPAPPDGTGSAPVSAADHVQGLLMGQAWREHHEGRWRRAVTTGLRACIERPSRVSGWKSLACLLTRRPATKRSV